MPSARPFAKCVVTAVLFAAWVSSPAQAQTDARVESAPADGALSGALGEARLRYGPTVRSGTDNPANLTYSGVTPGDLALSADYFPAIIGADLRLQAEGFSLNSGSSKVTSGELIRAEVGPAARFSVGGFRVDALVNYQLAQLPSFGQAASPVFATVTRHSLLLASRAHFELPFGAMVEASAGVPIALSTHDSGGSASSTGFEGGGSLGYRVARSGRLAYVAFLDYQFVRDTLTGSGSTGGTTASQTLNRFGIAFEVQYLEPPVGSPPSRTGGLQVAVLDEATGKALEDAHVEVEAGERRLTLSAAADGRILGRDLPPGPAVVRATAGGYVPGESTGRINAGEDGQIELRLRREPPKLGGLSVTFVDKETQAPIPNAKAKVKEVDYIGDENGALSLIDLAPGPVEIHAEAPGYRPSREVAQVVAGQKSPVALMLTKVEKKQKAVFTGLVRSRLSGAAIPAVLEIPEAKVKTHADAKGAFSVSLAGGTYRVIISAPGFITQTKNVTVKEGDEVIFNVDLHPVGR